LSSIFKKLEDSTRVEIKTDKIAGNSCILKDSMIMIDDKKNAIDPSRVFLKKLIFPYFCPIIAAIESEMLMISNEGIEIDKGNSHITMHDEKKI
tara:strand:+ start:378 stop:659 length:282 start_codon:yes stop_codon:yes gene_type:complete